MHVTAVVVGIVLLSRSALSMATSIVVFNNFTEVRSTLPASPVQEYSSCGWRALALALALAPDGENRRKKMDLGVLAHRKATALSAHGTSSLSTTVCTVCRN